MSLSEEIVCCGGCNGVGKIRVVPYRRKIEPKVIDCPKCDGDGRVLKVTKVTILKLREKGKLRLEELQID